MTIYYKCDEYILSIDSSLNLELNNIVLSNFDKGMDIINTIAPLELNQIHWRLLDAVYSIGYREDITLNTNESVYIDGERMELETPDRPEWKPISYKPRFSSLIAVNTDTNYIEERYNNTIKLVESLKNKELSKYMIYLLNTVIDSLSLTNRQYSIIEQLLTTSRNMKYKDTLRLVVTGNAELVLYCDTVEYDNNPSTINYDLIISEALYYSIINELTTQCTNNELFLTESYFSAKSAESPYNEGIGNYKIKYADEQASYRANIESWGYRSLSTIPTESMNAVDLEYRHHEIIKRNINRRYVNSNLIKERELLNPIELEEEVKEVAITNMYGW